MINRIIALLMFVSISFSQDIFFDTDFEKYAEEEMRWFDEFMYSDYFSSQEYWKKNPINLTEPYNQAIDEGYDFHELSFFLSSRELHIPIYTNERKDYWYFDEKQEKMVKTDYISSSKRKFGRYMREFHDRISNLSGRAYILDDEGNLFAQGFIYLGNKRGKWRFYHPPNEDGIQNLHTELHYLQIRPPLKKENTQRFINETNLQKKRKVNDLQNYQLSCSSLPMMHYLYKNDDKYSIEFDGEFFKYDINGDLVVKGRYTTDFNYDEDTVRMRLKPGGSKPRSENYVSCLPLRWESSTKLNSYYHKSVNYVNNFNQNKITPDPLKDFDSFYSPIFKEIADKKMQKEQKRRQERKSREFNGPCDTYKLREWLEFSSRITYGDRFHSVEVSSPSSSGYVDYTVIIWKRSSGLDYKFGRTSCSDINQLR